MRIMYDAIDALKLPPGGDLYAGYIDGHWPSANAISARFPRALVVRIATNPGTNDGIVLDTEPGDATPEQAVNWVLKRRAAHVDPTVYCSLSEWPQVKAAFATHDVPEPHWWIAHYSPSTAIPAGAVALQHTNTPGYDVSAVADYWPGVDPAPKPPAPAPATKEDQDMQQIEPLSVHPGEYAYGIPAGYSHIGFVADGYNQAPAKLRVVTWNSSAPIVHDGVELGGTSSTKHNSVALTAVNGVAVNAVTIKREDSGTFPVGVYLW